MKARVSNRGRNMDVCSRGSAVLAAIEVVAGHQPERWLAPVIGVGPCCVRQLDVVLVVAAEGEQF